MLWEKETIKRRELFNNLPCPSVCASNINNALNPDCANIFFSQENIIFTSQKINKTQKITKGGEPGGPVVGRLLCTFLPTTGPPGSPPFVIFCVL